MLKKLSVLIFFILILTFLIPKAYALEFQQVFVRLDSLKVNAALSGTICAKPSSQASGVENKIIVEFPSGFTISSTPSNWTTSTTNLPEASSAWPSIGTSATSVSGNIVTFSSGDLTTNDLYCFNFSGSSSQNPSTSGNDKNGTITTKTSSNTTIDFVTYAVSIVGNNQINVTANVNPRVSDLQIDIASLDTAIQFLQDATLRYQITYGSYLNATFPITVEAQWSQGTISGNPTPSVDILAYVTASATNGINSTAPVVDLINRKITWTFNAFPANSLNNTVTFKLRTNSSYTGSLPVTFSVSARSFANTTTTPYDSVSQSYLYNLGIIPTSTPTPTSAPSAVTSTPTPTPTVTPVSTSLFTSIDINSILQNSASIFASTSQATRMKLSYGKNPQTLDKTISFNDYSKDKTFELEDLDANTNYYFRITATSSLGKAISSDMYVLTTAKGEPAKIEENSIIVTSRNNIIYNNTLTALEKDGKKEQFIVIPQNTNYQLTFAFKDKKSVKRAKIKLKKIIAFSKRVLGTSSFANEVEAASDNVSLLEIKPGVYTATVKSDLEPGVYEILASFIDENGNLSEESIGILKVTNPFTVYNQKREPVEGARVLLYLYNLSSKTYNPLSSTDLSLQNPSFTNHLGVVGFVLPKGKYKAEISDIGYKNKSISFAIEDSDTTDYPLVFLERETPNILRIIQYYIRSFNEVLLLNTTSYIDSLRISLRLFDLVAVSILSALIIFTLMSFSHRHKIELRSFISYFFYLLSHKQRNKKYINGVVFDQGKKPVVLANVYLTDVENETIIESAKTNGKGEFFFKKGNGKYQIMVMKKGYQPTPQLTYEEKEDVSFRITMEKKDIKSSIKDIVYDFISGVFGMTFEGLGILAFIFEILFIPSFGLVKVLPFLTISVFNIILWTMHLRHKHI